MTELTNLKDTIKTTNNSKEKKEVNFINSSCLLDWMEEYNVSFTFTSDVTSKLYLIGLHFSNDAKTEILKNVLSVTERSFDHCSSLCVHHDSLYLNSQYQLWRLNNVFEPKKTNETYAGFDRVYVPQIAYTTGNLNIHDMVMDQQDHLIFVNTLFSCLATISEENSFIPLWKPFFVSELTPEDRCHLTGVALKNGLVNYVTSFSQANNKEGWLKHLKNGGVVIDIKANEVVCDQLSMPHSPRFYQDKLWLLNSGTGYFGYVDFNSLRFEPVTFCPGFLRGLDFIGDYAVVAVSKMQLDQNALELPLLQNLKAQQKEMSCGLLIIDLKTGEIVHTLRLEGLINSISNVALLQNTKRPKAIGFKTDEIQHTFSIGIQTHT